MYFPIGWPKVLHGGPATKGHPVKVFRHKTRDIVIELRSHSVAFWQTRVSPLNGSENLSQTGCFYLMHALQLCILLASYERTDECVEKHGANVTAAIKADGTVLVIAVSCSGWDTGALDNTFIFASDHGW